MNRRAIIAAALTTGGLSAAVLLAGPASAGVLATPCTKAQMGNASVTTYPIPTLSNDPFLIASNGSGATGTLAFTARGGNSVQSYTPATGAFGVLASTDVQSPQGVAYGSDGSVWFTNPGPNTVGRITPTGVVSQFAIPSANSNPWGITEGPDGNMWFTEYNANKVARITAAGAITEFDAPLGMPLQIATGGDGRLWVDGFQGSGIAAFSPDGTSQAFSVTLGSPSLNGLTTGPDGNAWFLDSQPANPSVGVINAAGTVTEYPIGVAGAAPDQIASAGPSTNALWFTMGNGNIGRVTTAGVVTSYPATSQIANPEGIVTGPDGAPWFTEAGCAALGRMSTSPVVYGTMTSRPAVVKRGRQYTVRVKMSAKGKVRLGLIGGMSRVTVLNTQGKKGVTTIRMTIPTTLKKRFLGRVTLVLNAWPGGSANQAAQTAPVLVR